MNGFAWNLDLSPENYKSLFTPISYLQEQANALEKITGGKVYAKAEFKISNLSSQPKFKIDFYIGAPNLDGYERIFLVVRHGEVIFPVKIRSTILEVDVEAVDEESFLDEINKILSSDKLHEYIKNLYTLSLSLS